MNEGVLAAFHGFRPRTVDAHMFQSEAVRQQLERQIIAFPAYALPDLARPTVICGIVHAHGVGEVWMITGDGFKRTAPVVLQQQRQLCETMFKVLRLHRMHIFVETGREDARLWAGRLGFEYEATLKRMGSRGEDLDVYLWCNEEEKSWVE